MFLVLESPSNQIELNQSEPMAASQNTQIQSFLSLSLMLFAFTVTCGMVLSTLFVVTVVWLFDRFRGTENWLIGSCGTEK